MASHEFDNSFKAIPIPTPANFVTWQQKVRLLLANSAIWSIVMAKSGADSTRPARPVPVDPNAPTAAEQDAMSRYDAARSKAVAAIASAAGDNYLTVANPFIDKNDPGGLWDELERRLATRSGATRFNALTAFFSTLRLAGEAFADLGGRIASQRGRLQSLFPKEFTLMDFLNELETFQFLRAFPEDSIIKTTIIAQGKLEPEHVRTMVDLLITAPTSSTAERATLATSPPQPAQSIPCTWCNRNGHIEPNCYSRNDYHKLFLRERAEGIRRGRNGYIVKSDGPAGKGPPNPRFGNKDRRQDPEFAKVSETTEETAGIASLFTSLADPQADHWTLDSGASRHMAPRKEWLHSLRPDRRPIKVADGRYIFSAGIGSVILRPKAPTAQGLAFLLEHVLYVPELNANLISANQMSTSQGFKLVTADNTTEFFKDGKLTFTASINNNNMAHLDVDTQHCETAAHAFAQVLPATLQRWHQRWAHAGNDLLKDMKSSNAVRGFSVKKGPEIDNICEPCIEGKLHRAPHTKPSERASHPLELVSTDVKGPFSVQSRQGSHYWIVFMCQYSGFAAVYFMREKREAAEKFKLYKAWAENQLSTTIKRLRDDKGGEYQSLDLQDFINQAGIERERTIRDTPQQNGQAERFNLTLEEAITSMLSQAKLPPHMWQDAASTFVHLHNREPSKSRGMKSPYELWYGRTPSMGHLRVWGSLAYVHLQKDQRAQLSPHAKRCVFIRYATDARGWVFWDTEKRKEIVSDSAVFDEETFPGTLTGKINRRIIDISPLEDPQPIREDDTPIENPTMQPPLPEAPPVEPLSHSDPVQLPENGTTGGINTTNPSAPDPTPTPRLIIRLPGAIQREQMRQMEEVEMRRNLPRELRALTDRTHFDSRHNDEELPTRRGNRAPPQERGLNIEEISSTNFSNFTDDREMKGVNDKVLSGKSAAVTPPSANQPTSIPCSPHLTSVDSPTNSLSVTIPLIDAIDFALSTSNTSEPKSLKEALSRPDADKWIAAAADEIEAHLKNKTWELCRLPAGKKAIGSRWVFKIKYNTDGSIERYKGRIVAKGYAQRQGVDYTETFAPTARFAALRSVIALAAIEDLELEAIDISTAFLNGDIDSEVYMEVPEGVQTHHENDDHKLVVRLLKGLYGIKQGPRIWARKLHSELANLGFERLECDHSVFIYKRDNIRIIIPVHVDDLLLASKIKEALANFKAELGKRFKIRDLGPVKQILGIQLERDRQSRSISLSQTHYIEEIIKEHIGDVPFNGTHIPMDDLNTVLVKGPSTEEESKLMERVDYRALVGKLLYLSIATRPDIAFAVGVLCRYNDCPGPQHWNAAKRVLRYLHQTKLLKLTYSPSNSAEIFTVYSDADLGGDPRTSRSTAGYVTKIGTGAVSWGSRLQKFTALSSTEAEYTTASAAATELMWMRYFLEECGYDLTSPSVLFMDNASAIQVAKNPEHQSTMKHVHREYNWIRENVEQGLIRVAHVPSAENVADIFTKPLKRPSFTRLRDELGLRL